MKYLIVIFLIIVIILINYSFEYFESGIDPQNTNIIIGSRKTNTPQTIPYTSYNTLLTANTFNTGSMIGIDWPATGTNAGVWNITEDGWYFINGTVQISTAIDNKNVLFGLMKLPNTIIAIVSGLETIYYLNTILYLTAGPYSLFMYNYNNTAGTSRNFDISGDARCGAFSIWKVPLINSTSIGIRYVTSGQKQDILGSAFLNANIFSGGITQGSITWPNTTSGPAIFTIGESGLYLVLITLNTYGNPDANNGIYFTDMTTNQVPFSMQEKETNGSKYRIETVLFLSAGHSYGINIYAPSQKLTVSGYLINSIFALLKLGPESTMPPTSAPTLAPTPAPTPAPTMAPTLAPTQAPYYPNGALCGNACNYCQSGNYASILGENRCVPLPNSTVCGNLWKNSYGCDYCVNQYSILQDTQTADLICAVPPTPAPTPAPTSAPTVAPCSIQ